jgi:hypothetical protein
MLRSGLVAGDLYAEEAIKIVANQRSGLGDNLQLTMLCLRRCLRCRPIELSSPELACLFEYTDNDKTVSLDNPVLRQIGAASTFDSLRIAPVHKKPAPISWRGLYRGENSGYCKVTSTRRPSAAVVAPALMSSGFFSSSLSSGAPAAFNTAWTAMARCLESSAFLAGSPLAST